MTRHSYHFVAVLVFALSTLGVPEAALAQDTGTQEAQGLEPVLRATEGLPAAERDEILSIYHDHAYVFHFYDPACIALGYGEWRRENRDVPGDVSRLVSEFQRKDDQGRISACVDRDRIVSNTIAGMERPGSPWRLSLAEDQLRRLSTCTAELVADRYLEDPGPNPPNRRYQQNLHTRALTQCQHAMQMR